MGERGESCREETAEVVREVMDTHMNTPERSKNNQIATTSLDKIEV